MKKFLGILMALVLICCAAVTAVAEEAEDVPMPEAAADFEGEWECDRAEAEFYWEIEGFKVLITWSSSAWEASEWEYSCYFNEEDNTLVSVPFGIRTNYVYDDNGDVKSSEVVYEDGQATFAFDEENLLVWKDEKENAGDGMQFVKKPKEFEGVWGTAEEYLWLVWEEEGYRILIHKADGTEDGYSGYYHEDTNTVVGVFDDITLGMDEEGNLIWGDKVLAPADPSIVEEAEG